MRDYIKLFTFQKRDARIPHDDAWFTAFEVLDTLCDNDDVWFADAVIKLKGLATSKVAAVKERVDLVQDDDFDFVVFSWQQKHSIIY